MVDTPIRNLSRSVSLQQDTSILAVVSLLWPYSSLTKQCAFLLADPDFRLRNHRGQIRVLFSGPAAEAVANSRVGIGDSITLRLEGARWSEEKDVTSTPGRNVDTPGKSVDGELLYDRNLHLKVLQDGVEKEIHVDAGDHVQQSEIPALPPPGPNIRTHSNMGRLADMVPVYSSPAFVKRLRHSTENYVDFAQEPFENGDEQREDAHTTPFNKVKQWRFASRTPSPTKDVASVVDTQHKAPVLSPAEFQTQDSPSPVKRANIDIRGVGPAIQCPASRQQSDAMDDRPDPIVEVVSLLSSRPASPVDARSQDTAATDMAGSGLAAIQRATAGFGHSADVEVNHDPPSQGPVDATADLLSNLEKFVQTTGQVMPARKTRKRPQDPDFDEMYDVSDREDESEGGANVVVQRQNDVGLIPDHITAPPAGNERDSGSVGQIEDPQHPGSVDAVEDLLNATVRSVHDATAPPLEAQPDTIMSDRSPSASREEQESQHEDFVKISDTARMLEIPVTPRLSGVPNVSQRFVSTTDSNEIMTQTFASLFGFGARRADPTDGESDAQSVRSAVEEAIEVIEMRSPNANSQAGSTVSTPRALLDHFASLPPEALQSAAPPEDDQLQGFKHGANIDRDFTDQPIEQQAGDIAKAVQAKELSKPRGLSLEASTVGNTAKLTSTAVEEPHMYNSQPSSPTRRAQETLYRDSGNAGTTEYVLPKSSHGEALEIVEITSSVEGSDSEGEASKALDEEEEAETQALSSAWDNFVESTQQEHEALEESERQQVVDLVKQSEPTVTSKDLEVKGTISTPEPPPPSETQPEAPTHQAEKLQRVMDTPVRKGFSSRLSGLPATMATWFSPKTEKQEQPKALAPIEPKAPAHLKKSTSSGLRTSYGYFTPLSQLERLVNSRQASDRGGVDVMAVVTTAAKEPTRASSGPRDYYTIMEVSDASLPRQKIRVEVFRPWKAKLPVAEVGDVVLLRSFAVKSRKRQPYLLSGDESAYCVWRFADAPGLTSNAEKPAWARKETNGVDGTVREEMKGPMVEFGEEEREQVKRLKIWYDEKYDNHDEMASETNGHAAQELTAKS